MQMGYNQKQYAFYLGYYVHLLTDVLWKQEVWYPSVKKYREAYEADPKDMTYNRLLPQKKRKFGPGISIFIKNKDGQIRGICGRIY